MKQVTFHVISHTHWDREWYLPFEIFRIELVDLIDDLLNILEQDNNFIFHLDGYSLILEDYLEIKPDKKEILKKYIKSGNIQIGPWHVLSDQFLTSGEATIRNLLYGIRTAKDFGKVMLVGYLPDQFGHIAQLPQIFKGFNIKSSVIGRGIQDNITEHLWHALNGDSVLAVSLTHWYNNAQRLPDDKKEFNKFVTNIYKKQKSNSGHVLLMNGCDHLFPQANVNKILKNNNSNHTWKVKQSKLPDVVNLILENTDKETLPVRYGELRDDNEKMILSGTLSSRVYLKLANYLCETQLEKIIEPLASILTFIQKTKYPYEEIKYAWRLLLQNHAHDSICGCSIDEVHREMEVRFQRVEQITRKLKLDLLSLLNTRRDAPTERLYIQLINLTNYRRNEPIEIDLEFPLGPVAESPDAKPVINKKEIKGLKIYEGKKEADFEILENYKTERFVRKKDQVPLLQAVQRIKLLLKRKLKPFSIATYEIKTKNGFKNKKKLPGSKLEFENKNYKLSINKNGTLDILLKEKNHKFKNLHLPRVEVDLGDEYHFIARDNVRMSGNPAVKRSVTEENKFRKVFLVKTSLPDLKLETRITCYKDSDRIDFQTTAINSLQNKRIQLHFPTSLDTNYISADTPFGILQRARPPVDWKDHANTQPIYNFIDHTDNKCGLAFFGGGLREYELYENGDGFAVTLIRCIGRLSTIRSHSLLETPDAQCNRKIIFNYALYPHIGNSHEAQILKEQLIYKMPLLSNQTNLKTNISGLIQIEEKLVISSLKRSEDKENLHILRLYNPTEKTLEKCTLGLNFPYKKVYLVKLNEEKIQELEKLTFEIKPFEILTFGIEI